MTSGSIIPLIVLPLGEVDLTTLLRLISEACLRLFNGFCTGISNFSETSLSSLFGAALEPLNVEQLVRRQMLRRDVKVINMFMSRCL